MASAGKVKLAARTLTQKEKETTSLRRSLAADVGASASEVVVPVLATPGRRIRGKTANVAALMSAAC